MMEESKTSRLMDHLELPAPPALTVGVAINGKKKSKYVVSWALDKFVQEGAVEFRLLYVRPKTTSVPTPMGAAILITEVRDDVAAAYRQELDWQANEMLLPYKRMCTRRKVKAEITLLESDDVPAAIADELSKHAISRLVVGLSFRGFFSRKLNMSSMIAEAAPSYCTVYVISKGKLSSVRPSDSEASVPITEDASDRSSSTSGSSGQTSGPHAEVALVAADPHLRAGSLPVQRTAHLSSISGSLIPMETSSSDTNWSRSMTLDAEARGVECSYGKSSETRQTMSWSSKCRDSEGRRGALSSSSSNQEIIQPASRSVSWASLFTDNHSRISHQTSTLSDALSGLSTTDSQMNLNYEIERLRAELRHVQEMYAMAQTETIDASRKLNDLNQRRLEEAIRLEELSLKEREAKDIAAKEKERYEEAIREAEKVSERAEKEALQRREAELKAARDLKEKEKLANTLTRPSVQYQHFTWEEIVAATSNFSDGLKIGFGAYGTVYKCNLHHTTAAVKVLHPGENKLSKQFQQELEILSKIRHPHLLLLLGACPEEGCLVYEYMENGSLEDRLLHVNGTPPIPWYERFRIAWEVASALVFLHKSKPKPIIHRDLKPANILLDHNFVSKVGDVGLSTMVQDVSSKFTIYKTSPVGTLCYIDPEYQRTGMISPKSDVYSLGVVILQLVTAKPAIALTHMVEEVIGDDAEFLSILDSSAGNWPINETREFAALALCCTELRRKDRPDLKDQILPALDRLRKAGDKAQHSRSMDPDMPPGHFICPLLKDVMKKPCVAADGYTYDREAIEEWLKNNDMSPMTKLPLPNKNLLPNYTLYAAITEWKSRRP